MTLLNSPVTDKIIKIYDNGNIKIDILFTLGYTTSGAPKNIGIKEFPKPPNNPGISKKIMQQIIIIKFIFIILILVKSKLPKRTIQLI